MLSDIEPFSLISRIIEGWNRSDEHKATKKGCALGYMGHLSAVAAAVKALGEETLGEVTGGNLVCELE